MKNMKFYSYYKYERVRKPGALNFTSCCIDFFSGKIL